MRPLADLGPPQKSRTLNRRGRTLKITTPLLVWGSCGIGRPFGDEKRLRSLLAAGDTTKLHRRLEADAKALVAYYEYARLHDTVRLRWGFLDEVIAAPWVDRDEPRLYALVREALDWTAGARGRLGSAPGGRTPGRGPDGAASSRTAAPTAGASSTKKGCRWTIATSSSRGCSLSSTCVNAATGASAPPTRGSSAVFATWRLKSVTRCPTRG